ncbi:dipeptidyl aminopeptidase [Boletus reticuloceps]|uniref:Dipeptidyl aminopeptidase n=1 Tax=Boletus reticuloceps TaxID=495285 RepID=A0A8I2Z100_9AGAM|nr:dipeptidyl aminopeptidase [Boletus reticuloceps]
MPNPTYERVSDNDTHEDVVETSQPPRARPHPALAVRPPVYYGDGSFDPPSSEEGDEDRFQDKYERGVLDPDGFSDSEPGNGLRVGGTTDCSEVSCILSGIISILSACIGVFAATNLYYGKPYHASRERKVALDHIFNGTFSKHVQALHWVPEAGDGVFSTRQNEQIQLVDLKTNTTTSLVSFADIRDENGQVIYSTSWKLSPDMKYILVKANHHKQWRYSSFGNYYVHSLETKVTFPLLPPTNPPVTAYATWSPTGESIVFVAANDLYILPSPSASTSSIRVTTSGNASLFHGVPDWIYEEEVLSQDYALWWSPDSSKIAFLRLDETTVEEYRFPIYNPTEDSYAVIPYTEDVVIKYPKPGYNNPLVSVHVFDLEVYLSQSESAPTTDADDGTVVDLKWSNSFPSNNSIISQVAWVDNSTLVLKEVTRAADHGNVVLFDMGVASPGGIVTGKVVRKLGIDGEEGDGGWIDAGQNIYPVPPNLRSGDSPAYLDIVPNQDGYNHIALFDPATSSTPRFLTSGTWEVTNSIQAVDAQRGLIYFQAARPSIERHLYSVPISSPKTDSVAPPTPLTDNSTPSSYSASFSPGAGFYLLNYAGPNVPWQRVVDVSSPDFDYVLADNAALNTTLGEFEAATITYSTIDSDGYELNVKEMRPPKMDDSGRTKYPVLFFVYGGPESQKVNVVYQRDWHDYLVCTLQYVVVVVDGRGTGFKGRQLRNPVRYNMGFWETLDQINAARIWAGKDYVDPKRIGIWGWSYGGFMASKVAEADAGIHTLSMAIAVSWMSIDSIYTERYMGLPDDNPGGYINASISHVEGFKNIDFLFAHGSGDDNVHLAHSAHLLDMLTAAQVRDFRFRMFTDSDHSITKRGANREVYEYMSLFLLEKWGKGGRRRGW